MIAKPPRKPPVRGRNGPGVMGRPRLKEDAKARAVALVDAGTHTPEEAAAVEGIGGNTVRRALKERDEATAETLVQAAEIGPVEALEVPEDVRAAIVTVADPEKARAVRRLVQGMGGSWDGESVGALAVTWGCAVEDVRALVIEAAIQAGRCVLPPELAREEALAALRHVREKAKSAADWKSVTLATTELLKIQLAAGEGEGLTKAQFVALARELLEAVKPYPGAYEAAIGVMFPPGQ